MGARKILFTVLALSLLSTGCESMGPKTQTGAIAGGLIGVAAGGIIGHQSGHGLEGAAIGGALGALGGGVVGNQMDQQGRATNPSYLPITSIVDMAQKGLPDDVIIGEIQRTRSTYRLTSEVITYLKQNKVSDRVVDYMLSTAK